MKKVLVLNVLILFIILLSEASADSEAEIRNSYGNLKVAMLSGDGEKASQFVCEDVFNYYNEARKLALNSEIIDIEKEPQIKVLVILQLRYLLSKIAMNEMSNGQDVFAWGVKNGLVTTDVFKQFTLNNIQIKNDSAFASIIKNGVPVEGVGYNFKNEGGHWKLDLIKLLSAPDKALEQVRQQAGKTKIELAIYMMEENYKKPIPSEILNGPLN